MAHHAKYVLVLAAFLGSCLSVPQESGNSAIDTGVRTTDYSSKTADPFPKWAVPPPAEWVVKPFEPSHDFPSALPPNDATWAAIDFRSDPRGYLDAVLAYVLQGNEEVEFDVGSNRLRKWYHVPWLTTGTYGREAIAGLTRERSSRPGELSPGQTVRSQNWAVGFYNPRGAFAIGKVWRDRNAPDTGGVLFDEGSVAAKLLYTSADDLEVPTLKDAYIRQAHIHASTACQRTSGPDDPNCKRVISVVRLIQLDVAVRDARSPTGWVYGTFVFNGSLPGTSPWKKLEPLGLMWGDDANKKAGLSQSIILPVGSPQHLGCFGRLNGPVDNPGSSCISCHSRAGFPDLNDFAPDDCKTLADDRYAYYFKDVVYPATFDSAKQPASYDYSLQLSAGVANFMNAKKTGGAAQ